MSLYYPTPRRPSRRSPTGLRLWSVKRAGYYPATSWHRATLRSPSSSTIAPSSVPSE